MPLEGPIRLESRSRLARRPNLRLRPARRSDLDAIVAILRSSADWYEPLVEADDMDQHAVDRAWAEDNFDKRDFFVGELDGQVVGTVTLQDAGEYSYLGYVYLHAAHTGKGLGKSLLAFARDESRRRGDRGMVLISHPDADWAVRAYERFGFECIADSDASVLAWNNGWLKPYHEVGFHLFRYLHEAR